MEITDIRIKKLSAEGKMKAVVSVTFDDAFVVHDIKDIEKSILEKYEQAMAEYASAE